MQKQECEHCHELIFSKQKNIKKKKLTREKVHVAENQLHNVCRKETSVM